MKSLADRIEWKFIPEPNSGCWLWTAAMRTDGYGHVNTGFGYQPAHRVSWRVFCGEIPEGMNVLHKCDNRLCMNPEHLQVGTQSENLRQMVERNRSAQRSSTHCRNGHPYSDSNTTWKSTGIRQCRICNNARNQRWRDARENKPSN